MKQKRIVLIILICITSLSSAIVLASDGYLGNKKDENKILAVEHKIVAPPIVLAKESTSTTKPTIKKTTTAVKKAPVKKAVVKKKPVVKKKSVNLNPPVFTPATAPYSAKNKNN